MNGLPLGIDLTKFNDARVIQLCFGENQLQFHFDNDDSVAVEGKVIIRGSVSTDTRVDRYATEATRLCGVLGKRVSLASRVDDGGLRLRFENGIEITVLNSKKQYESFQVHIGGTTHVA
jgi:hypothetical protein